MSNEAVLAEVKFLSGRIADILRQRGGEPPLRVAMAVFMADKASDVQAKARHLRQALSELGG